MFVSAVLLLLLGVVIGGGEAHNNTHPLYPHLLQPTNVTCVTTADCMAHYNNSWCHRGQLCRNGRCHRLPEHPCPHTERCDAKNKTCVPKACRSARDCDDHIFCNGAELCINATCRVGHETDCSRGFCDERTHRCHIPRNLAPQNAQTVQQLYKSSSSYSVYEGQVVVVATNSVPYRALNTTEAPTSSSTLSDGAQIAIICAASVVFAAILILLIIALVSR